MLLSVSGSTCFWNFSQATGSFSSMPCSSGNQVASSDLDFFRIPFSSSFTVRASTPSWKGFFSSLNCLSKIKGIVLKLSYNNSLLICLLSSFCTLIFIIILPILSYPSKVLFCINFIYRCVTCYRCDMIAQLVIFLFHRTSILLDKVIPPFSKMNNIFQMQVRSSWTYIGGENIQVRGGV